MPRKRNMGFRIKPMKHTGLPPPIVLEPPAVAINLDIGKIESAETAFSGESNMLDGDHPLYTYVDKVFGDFAALNTAMDLMRFEHTITREMTGEVKKALDAFNQTFRVLEVVQTGL